ncbi:hypothetical protein E2C01_098610 [Portunus trituberculatus]|uniref:Uncharacterized protein n=1 Tax=Portunus trituberculatus TaxID=210409 RepID=A0A5B7K8U7_PORTR|nr:hypothetical protein [Portunus trituberculatus]
MTRNGNIHKNVDWQETLTCGLASETACEYAGTVRFSCVVKEGRVILVAPGPEETMGKLSILNTSTVNARKIAPTHRHTLKHESFSILHLMAYRTHLFPKILAKKSPCV